MIRGDLDPLVVPLALFRPSGEGLQPDPSRFSVIDSGWAVRLGKYEASAAGILYESDPDFRRRLNAKRKREERTFGASLRRLRLQKGLRQDELAPLSAKTIARIEKSAVAKPHRRTLLALAKRLGVKPAEIGGY